MRLWGGTRTDEDALLEARALLSALPDGLLVLDDGAVSSVNRRLCEMLGFEGEVRWDTTKPDGQPRRAVDGDRAEKLFGFRATTPLDVGLRRTIDWYLSHRDEAEARRN